MTGGGGTSGEDDDQSKGPVAHQESKTFDGEYQLLTVFDNADRKLVTFEAYSLETSEVLSLRYTYPEFDQFFRFNAELMNPNNREGRYHWIMKRLVFASDGSSGRKLALGGKPTEETPEVPVYTQAKIPTGRMNFNERQRLRDEMERLDMRRNESIEKKRIARDGRFMAVLEEQKTLLELKQTSRKDNISREKKERYGMIAESHQADLDRKMELMMLDTERAELIKQLEARRMTRSEEGVQETIQRFRVEREAKQKLMEEAGKQKAQIAEEIVKNDDASHTLAENLEARREEQWALREERIGKKEDTYLAWLQQKNEEEARKQEIVEEKRQNEVRTARQGREVLFSEQFKTSLERAAYAQATKPKAPGEKSPRLEVRKQKKKGTGANKGGSSSSTEKKSAMDPVHEQMMEHIAQKNLVTAMEKQRIERQALAVAQRNQQEYEKHMDWKEHQKELQGAKAAEYKKRTDLRDEKLAQQKADELRIKADRERLDALREMRIRDKALAREK